MKYTPTDYPDKGVDVKPRETFSGLITAILLAALLCAAFFIPVVAASGLAINQAKSAMDSKVEDIATTEPAQFSTMVDRNGNIITHLYEQRRLSVPSDEIAPVMKQAIVAVEDRRFFEHGGVDLRGTARALAKNILAGDIAQGASTLDQQYVKNYLLLVSAQNEKEQNAATAESVTRKLREMRMAADVDRTFTKDEILTRYLNLVSFGNGVFGVNEASHYYFATSPDKLTAAQAATLAGMVQSTQAYNPYVYPEATKARRDIVLQLMADTGVLTPQESTAAQNKPLGIVSEPPQLPNGCIGSGDRGFFCDYVLKYLNEHGISTEKIKTEGYLIKTSLDPRAQDAARRALAQQSPPSTHGASQSLNLIDPKNKHAIVAMASSRNYGLDDGSSADGDATSQGKSARTPVQTQTVLPLTSSTVGNGAGSVFKIFAAAAGIKKGMGIGTIMPVPPRLEVDNMGHGGADNCPPTKYCVENATRYKSQMTLQQALATSPNTAFVDLERRLGVPAVVDMAVKLGLRSLDKPTGPKGKGPSLATTIKKENMGSFVLGPIGVNPLELTNVAATLADGGRWCEPTPIVEVRDRKGKVVPLKKPQCERVLSVDQAAALAHGLSDDVINGSAEGAAKAVNFSAPIAAKTGTTETNNSAAFLAFDGGLAGSVYTFNDGTTVTPLCTSPLRQCTDGTLFGGEEPARTLLSTWNAVSHHYGDNKLPALKSEYIHGKNPEKLDYSATGTVTGVPSAYSSNAGTFANRGGNASTRRPYPARASTSDSDAAQAAAAAAAEQQLRNTVRDVIDNEVPPEVRNYIYDNYPQAGRARP